MKTAKSFEISNYNNITNRVIVLSHKISFYYLGKEKVEKLSLTKTRINSPINTKIKRRQI